MKRYKFILLMVAISLGLSCERFDGNSSNSESTYSNVEVLEDGRLKVTATLERLGMTTIETRASNYEDAIYNGWCLVFGETDAQSTNYVSDGYGDESPLIQITPITANANGTFFMTFTPYEGKSFMRIIVNLTDRENETLSNIVTWQDLIADGTVSGDDAVETPTYAQVINYRDNNDLATFGEYRHQSVGLDGIYDITYNTTSNLEYISEGITDYSNETVYYTVNYQNPDGNRTSGKNYLTDDDETYNGNVPDPATQLNSTKGFPMASYGFVLEDLSEETLANSFGTVIDMIRVCSKVEVDVEDSGFDMQEVYVIDAVQESRIRSTVLSGVVVDDEGVSSNTTKFNIPVDLGGTITYGAMPVSSGETTSDPIYFYPNSGGDYEYSTTVDNDINPQYIIIKGQAEGYDTPGYYKVALKAQYPLATDSDESNMDDRDKWSELTYDILRNTSFTVKLTNVDKPGYKTFEDAADVNSPANNISYSITIESSNNRYEVLVSKGTYYVELASSRIYAKGYGTEGLTGEEAYVDFTMFPTEDNVVPAVYVQSSDYDNDSTIDNVTIDYCKVLRKGDAGYENSDWSSTSNIDPITNNTGDGLADKLVHIVANTDEDQKKETKVRVYFTAKNSGRIRLRIGDMLKFIPIVYEADAIKTAGESQLTITDEYGTSWNNFAYDADSDIEVMVQTSGGVTDASLPRRILQHDGSAVDNTGNYNNLELHTRVYTSDNSGIAQIYLKQASDFDLWDNVTAAKAATSQAIVYQSTGNIYTYNGEDVTTVEDNDIRSYTINGEVDFEQTGDAQLTNFNQTGEIALGETFTFYGEDIKTNQGSTYVAANSHLSNSTTITLTNIANETATYTIAVDQYALPYVETTYTTSNDRMIFQGGKADMYGATTNNKGEDLNYIYVSNAYYTAIDNEGSTDALGYHWQTTDFKYVSVSDLEGTYYNKAESYSSTSYNLGRVYYAVSIQHDEIDTNGNVADIAGSTNRHQFYGKVNTKDGTLGRDGAGYFVLTIGNEANERLLLYIYFTRSDGSI